jgi:hypothetical protein
MTLKQQEDFENRPHVGVLPDVLSVQHTVRQLHEAIVEMSEQDLPPKAQSLSSRIAFYAGVLTAKVTDKGAS